MTGADDGVREHHGVTGRTSIESLHAVRVHEGNEVIWVLKHPDDVKLTVAQAKYLGLMLLHLAARVEGRQLSVPSQPVPPTTFKGEIDTAIKEIGAKGAQLVGRAAGGDCAQRGAGPVGQARRGQGRSRCAMSYTAAEKLEAIQREIMMRRAVYGRRVTENKMTARLAEKQIGLFEEIAADYERLAAQERLL